MTTAIDSSGQASSRAQQAYATRFRLLRLSTQMDYPGHVHLETLALCNAACGFCPYPELDRQGARMESSVIEKVISDLTDVPPHHPFMLSPFKVNEPFLDARLFDILAEVNARLPQAKITLTTNATPITSATLAKLSNVARLGYLWISVNDYREAEYEASMRLPFKRTLERLNLIHAAKAAGALQTRIVMSRVGDGSEHDLHFRAWVARDFPLFESSVFPRGNWLGQVDAIQAAVPDLPCQRWFELSITATGIVAHCCMDGKADHPIGDIRTEHVLEVYNKPAYRHLREATQTRLDVDPCRSCAFL